MAEKFGAKLLGRGIERVAGLAESRGVDLGIHVADHDLVEAYAGALRSTWRELEDLGWQVLDYSGGNPQESSAPARKKMVAKSKTAWMNDPQAGAYVALMNDFVLGRGFPRPRCKDQLVQTIVDEAWDDEDNKRVLTSFKAQLALNTDLSIQCNVFPLGFDDGKDGRFKLGLLQHDAVETAVRDPENYLRVLYYLARFKRQEWDFANDRPKMDAQPSRVLYYENWGALDEAKKQREEAPDGADMLPLDEPPTGKLGRGKVYHLALNRTTEMVFGWPEMARSIRWFSAYNDLMAARVDIATAVASLVMKRKTKGTPDQMARTAARYLSRESPLASTQLLPRGALPAPGSTVVENENVTHEPFNLDSRAANAAQDARMVGAQISAAHRFPRSYFGDQEAGSLATATSLELPVLKSVEARQEIWESLVRWFVQCVIDKAVEDGLLPTELTPKERAEKALKQKPDVGPAVDEPDAAVAPPAGAPPLALQAAGTAAHAEEDEGERDLSFDFSLPSPLRRQMPELVAAITQMAQTFDPDNTNVELSRALLMIGLSEALEVADAADIVDLVFPPGYKTMATKQFEQQQAPPANPFAPEAAGTPVPSGEGGQAVKPGPDGKPPGGIGGALPAETAYPQLQQALVEGRVSRRRDGTFRIWDRRPPAELIEADEIVVGSLQDLPEDLEMEVLADTRDQFDEFDRDVLSVAVDVLTRPNGNGNGNGKGV